MRWKRRQCLCGSLSLGMFRHLRNERLSWKHIDQSRTYLKWLIEHGEIRRVADFRADKIKAALVKLDNKGLSARTVNVYRRCAHSLAAWATELDEPLMEGNPITRKRVKRRDEKADRRKTRRALTVEEAERLLAVSGPRRLFYATALWSGLRVGELRKLEWRDVLLEGDRPELQLRAEATKSKRADTLPIHPDLADLLRAAKPKGAEPADRVFRVVPILRTLTGGHQTYKTKTGEVRRFRDGDLQRAGITARDARGRSVDLHALRTTFGTWLADKGVPEHKRRVLLRHADETVTEKSYTDPRLFDLWHEIAKLPKIRKVSDAAESLRATGTDDVSSANLVGLPVGPKAVRKGVKLSQTGRKGGRRVKRTSLPGSSKTLRK